MKLAALALLAYATHWYRTGHALSPDGGYYLRPAAERPRPYSLRWLAPAVLGGRPWAWAAVSAASIVGAAWLLPPRAAWLFLWLPMTALNVRLPVLVDAPAFLAALGSAWAASRGQTWLAVALGLLAGATKESAPVFAAAWSLSPWPLLGLLAAGWWRRPAPADQPWLERPWSSARRDPLDWWTRLYPWGAPCPSPWLAGPGTAPAWRPRRRSPWGTRSSSGAWTTPGSTSGPSLPSQSSRAAPRAGGCSPCWWRTRSGARRTGGREPWKLSPAANCPG